MQTYTMLLTRYQELSQNSTAANTTFFNAHLNGTQRTVLTANGGRWWFLEVTDTTPNPGVTVASQRNYQLPANLRKVLEVTLTVGTTIYRPKPVTDPAFWEYLLSLNTSASDATDYYYLIGNEIHFYPAPATAGSTITIRHRRRIRDFSFLADYTTGTVDAVTNASQTITGAGTTWVASWGGRFLRVSYVSAASTGDGLWYEISSVASTTSLTLIKDYEGTTVASPAGLAYTIGEVSIIPQEYHDMLLYRPLALYYQQNDDATKATMYWRLYDGGKEAGLLPAHAPTGGLLGQMIDEANEKYEGAYIEPQPIVRMFSAEERSLRNVEGDNWV